MSQRGIRLGACLLTALTLSGCSVNLNAERLVKREERRFPVTGKPEIVLKTFDGAIQYGRGTSPRCSSPSSDRPATRSR